MEVAQDGEEIGTVVPMDSVPEDDCNDLYVRPGATIRCTSVRKLVDETSPVTFTVGDFSAEDKLEVDMYFKLLSDSPCEVEVCDKHISLDMGHYFEELIGLIFPVA